MSIKDILFPNIQIDPFYEAIKQAGLEKESLASMCWSRPIDDKGRLTSYLQLMDGSWTSPDEFKIMKEILKNAVRTCSTLEQIAEYYVQESKSDYYKMYAKKLSTVKNDPSATMKTPTQVSEDLIKSIIDDNYSDKIAFFIYIFWEMTIYDPLPNEDALVTISDFGEILPFELLKMMIDTRKADHKIIQNYFRTHSLTPPMKIMFRYRFVLKKLK